MKRGILFILPIFMLTGLGVGAQSSPDATAAESKILALENAWGQAEKSHDSKALNTLLDDSLVYIRYDGSVWSKSQYLASLNDRSSREDQAVNETMTAHLYGDAALVTGIYRVKGLEKGQQYSRRERFIDTWVRRSDGWICVASQVTLIGH